MPQLCLNKSVLDMFSRNWSSITYKKFVTEVLKCSVMTKALHHHAFGIREFCFPYSRYRDLVYYLRSDLTDDYGYRYFSGIVSDLEEDYITRVLKGYVSWEGWGYSVYRLSDSFRDELSELNPNKCILIDLDTFKKRKFGAKSVPLYGYGNHEYTDFNEFYRQYAQNKNLDFQEANALRKEIRQNSRQIGCKLTTGIDYAYIKSTDKKIQTVPPNAVMVHKTYVNTAFLNRLAYDTDELYSRIAKELLPNITEENTIIQHYHHSKYGRLYQSGYNLQMMKKEYRREILDQYMDIDIKACVFEILYNYALLNGYKNELPFLERFVYDPDLYRKSVYEELLKGDTRLTYDYIKTQFIAMAYGANCREYKVIGDVIYGKRSTVATRCNGYSTYETPLNLVTMPDFKGLSKDVQSVERFMVKKVSETSKNQLTNSAGCVTNIQEIKKNELFSFIYQGLEVNILTALTNFKFGSKPLHSIDGAIGLLLHDGLYVKRNLIEPDTITKMESWITQTTGYKLKLYGE